MNPHAEELNKFLDGTQVFPLLSDFGKRIYFPKGILSQTAEATEKAHRFNATIGMAYDHNEPMILDAIREEIPHLSKRAAVAYAPTAGVAELRKRWRTEMERKNPSLKGIVTSVPVVVPGLTAGISFLGDLFLDPGDTVVLPDLFWPNYRLVITERKNGSILTYPMFDSEGRFNVEGFAEKLKEAGKSGKAIAILNFPNNPTGYSPSFDEAKRIVDTVKTLAESGVSMLVICDDAYFGLQFEPDRYAESLFGSLSIVHRNVLAAKVDGPTKEDYVWGFRVGFVTFAGLGLDEKHLEALVKKLMGVVRSAISNAPGPTQHILLRAIENPDYLSQKKHFRAILEERYKCVRDFLAEEPLPASLKPLPFNSGYFMCFECSGISAEELRTKLLSERGIGTIALGETHLRVAFSSVDINDIVPLYREIFAMASSLEK